MAHGRSGNTRSTAPSTRALALAVCIIALGLLAWRAADVFTRAPVSPGPLSQAEASLLAVAEAVAGPGQVRVSVARRPGGDRQILVLLDEKSPVDDAVLVRLVSAAAGQAASDGDPVVLQRAPFAPGVTGRPLPRDWAELSLLALLAGLGGWLGLAAARPEDQTAEIVREVLPARRMPDGPEAPAPVAPVRSAEAEAIELARRDPSRAAAVVRSWMGRPGDAA